jgi:carbonic anhydrase
MGHESCGAVNAACASDCAPGNINTIVREIQPAVRAGAKEPSKVIEANVKCVLNTIRKKSEILRLLEKGGKLKMAGAVYSFSTGAVSFL